jgi:hypothetical protein
MNKKQKQELFDAITIVGYKETELFLLDYLNNKEFDLELEDNHKTIIAWFNLWYNKGIYQTETQSVISFIQANTYTNPYNNTKKSSSPEDRQEFRNKWQEKFGPIKD